MALAAIVWLPATAHADGTTSFGATASAGWLHSRLFGVGLDFYDVDLGLGVHHTSSPGNGVDFDGTVSYLGGRTEGGRTISAFAPLGARVAFTLEHVRFGGAFRLGMLNIRRSTTGDGQSGGLADAYAFVGIEPLSFGKRGLFVEARAHTFDLGGNATTGYSFALGGRF
jgi:hypothetical protein